MITNASNASPIVITTGNAHGLSTGTVVEIEGVQGNTAANGIWTITNVSSTTFSLNSSTGNGAWSTPALWGPSLQVVSGTADTSLSSGTYYTLILVASGGTVSLYVGSIANSPLLTLSGMPTQLSYNNMNIAFGLESTGTVANTVSVSNLFLGIK
jgi:hypothetical protein